MSTSAELHSPRADLAGTYLAFRLGEEGYGIAVRKVREILRMVEITPVPQMPAHVRGVINLRGKIVPVLDLRLRFGLPAVDDGGRTCILVMEALLPGGEIRLLGAVVDWVEEVVAIRGAEVEETPAFGSIPRSDCILGIAKTKGGVRILLDIDRTVGDAVPVEVG